MEVMEECSVSAEILETFMKGAISWEPSLDCIGQL